MGPDTHIPVTQLAEHMTTPTNLVMEMVQIVRLSVSMMRTNKRQNIDENNAKREWKYQLNNQLNNLDK